MGIFDKLFKGFSRNGHSNGNLNSEYTIDNEGKLNNQIFGEIDENTTPYSNTETTDIDENLFMDTKKPEPDNTNKGQKTENKNPLVKFLETDYYSAGFNDGYDNAGKESYELSISQIKYDFMNAADLLINECKCVIINFKEYNLRTEGISNYDINLNKNRISEYEKNINSLIEEKEKAENDKGLVMKKVNEYKSGYIKGMNAYTEEKLLSSPTGIFY